MTGSLLLTRMNLQSGHTSNMSVSVFRKQKFIISHRNKLFLYLKIRLHVSPSDKIETTEWTQSALIQENQPEKNVDEVLRNDERIVMVDSFITTSTTNRPVLMSILLLVSKNR